MDGADEHGWSAVAGEWAELWGSFSDPARQAVILAAAIGAGTRVLDVGCGSGEFLVMLRGLGAVPSGLDPAPGMVDLARSRLPFADIRLGDMEELPWADDAFDVVTAVNALQFADDAVAALTELARVSRGFVAVANWAEDSRNDLTVLEAAVAAVDGDELPPDGPLRAAGGLEVVFASAGLDVTSSGLVDVPWSAPDDETLVRGVLLGEDAAGLALRGPAVVSAAGPFRQEDGSYLLRNAFRWVVGR